jgi:hypothetical protein
MAAGQYVNNYNSSGKNQILWKTSRSKNKKYPVQGIYKKVLGSTFDQGD